MSKLNCAAIFGIILTLIGFVLLTTSVALDWVNWASPNDTSTRTTFGFYSKCIDNNCVKHTADYTLQIDVTKNLMYAAVAVEIVALLIMFKACCSGESTIRVVAGLNILIGIMAAYAVAMFLQYCDVNPTQFCADDLGVGCYLAVSGTAVTLLSGLVSASGKRKKTRVQPFAPKVSVVARREENAEDEVIIVRRRQHLPGVA